MVRAAETGVSGIIDPVGRVLFMADIGAVAAPNMALPQPLPNGTFYSRWRTVPLFLGLGLTTLLAIVLKRRGA